MPFSRSDGIVTVPRQCAAMSYFLIISDDLACAVLIVGQVGQLMLLEHCQRRVHALVEVQASIDGCIGVVIYACRWASCSITIQWGSPAQCKDRLLPRHHADVWLI